MSRPTHLLKHQHRVIEQAMRALEGICFRMLAGEHVPAEELSKLLSFIHGYADDFHHAKEEKHLFPALREAGIKDEDGPLTFLRQEHERERKLLSELGLAVAEHQRDSGTGGKFVAAALQYKDHLIEHMQQEEAILFLLAEEMLDEQVKASLLHALAYQTPEAQKRIQSYEQLARELEQAWTV